MLLERCPRGALPQVLAGIELRFLGELGLLPPLTQCSRCERTHADGTLYSTHRHPGLVCRRHATDSPRAVPDPVLRWLNELRGSAGRLWPSLPPIPRGVRELLGPWVAAAIERRPKLRDSAFAAR